MDAEQLANDLSLAEENVALLESDLKAAKQRELELLAVIARAGTLLQEHGFVEGTEILCASPSQALREHEAKVLEDAAAYFLGCSYHDPADELRRMAEERRKK